MPQKTLDQIREEINAVDDALAQMLVQRAELAKQVRDVKKATDTQVYHPSRERSILDRVFNICKISGFSQEQVDKVFLSVISACRSIVGDLEITIPTALGGIMHSAVIKQFGPVENIVTANSIEEVVEKVQKGQSPYGIVPASNESDGVFNRTLFAVLSSDVSIITEICITPNVSLYGTITNSQEIHVSEDVVPLIDFKKLQLISESTKVVTLSQDKALRLSEIGKTSAVLLPDILGHIYPISVLKENVPVLKSNSLRFFVIGKPESNKNNHNVMVIVCVVKDKSGALRSLLEPFDKNNITLLAIESRASQKSPWESAFYIECECKGKFEILDSVLRELEKFCLHVRSLGSFYRESETRI